MEHCSWRECSKRSTATKDKADPIEVYYKTTENKILQLTALSPLEHLTFQLCKYENFILLQLTMTKTHMFILSKHQSLLQRSSVG